MRTRVTGLDLRIKERMTSVSHEYQGHKILKDYVSAYEEMNKKDASFKGKINEGLRSTFQLQGQVPGSIKDTTDASLFSQKLEDNNNAIVLFV